MADNGQEEKTHKKSVMGFLKRRKNKKVENPYASPMKANEDGGFLLNDFEIETLRATFAQDIKPSASEIGSKGVNGIFEKVPEALDIFSASPNRVIRIGDKWEIMSHGITFLNGIERALLRLDSVDHLNDYIRQLVDKHQSNYLVIGKKMVVALNSFDKVFNDHLSLLHGHDFGPNCPVCKAWQRFFSIFAHLILHHTLKLEEPLEKTEENEDNKEVDN